jgi:hypothetical protein
MKRKRKRKEQDETFFCSFCLAAPGKNHIPVFGGRIVALACNPCVKFFKKDPHNLVKCLEHIVRQYMEKEPAFYHPEKPNKESSEHGRPETSEQ